MDWRRLLDKLRPTHPDRDGSEPRSPRPSRDAFAPLVILVAAVVATAALWHVVEGGLPGSTVAPVAAIPDSQDDGAGDALTPSAEGETSLPVPGVLDDERVASALGPVARLSCRKGDPPALDDRVAADQARVLGEPLAATGADADVVAAEPLLAAANAPIAMVAVAPEPVSVDGVSCPALLHWTFNRLQTGKPESLCQFEGKVVLIVNTASYCGYTHQYEGLEAMYRKYKDRGFVVVGFPSNDFGNQEPGTNKEIAEFCRLTYGVQFPMYEKSSVTELRSNPLFAALAARTGKAPQWNFHKYVIDRNGQAVASFTSQVEPTDRALLSLIERLLAEQPRRG
jgi:glutathione peroxidase